MLENIKDILDRLTKKQQVILALSTVFSVVGILLMAMVATKTQMSLYILVWMKSRLPSLH